MLFLNEYQSQAQHTACYKTEHDATTKDDFNIVYPALGLAGETGEVVEKIKKVIRRKGEFTDAIKREIAMELGDVLWYVAALAKEIGFELDTIGQMNLAKLRDRRERGVIKGRGDNR